MDIKLFEEFVQFGSDRDFTARSARLTTQESKVLGDLLLYVYQNELKGSKAKYGLGKEEWESLRSVMSKIGITQEDINHLHIENKNNNEN